MTRKGLIYLILILLTAILLILSVCAGSADISPHIVISILSGGDVDERARMIVEAIRLPRALAAIVLGGGLSLSGYMLQSFFRNTIAGPYVLGISSGARLMVAAAMVWAMGRGVYLSSFMMIVAAFLGAFIVTAFVLVVSARVSHISVLILCGVMAGYVCSAVTELLVSFADDSNIVNLHSWSQGSFSSMSFDEVRSFAPVILICFVAAMLMSSRMEAFSYGEEYAGSLGLNVRSFKVLLIVTSSILSAVVTAFAGPISFVGIAVPHLIRTVFKSDRPVIIIPAIFLGGSIFCLISDLVARTLFAPSELSISTVTAIFGAPIVIMMLIKRNKR